MSILVVRWDDKLGRAGVFHVMTREPEWTESLASRLIRITAKLYQCDLLDEFHRQNILNICRF